MPAMQKMYNMHVHVHSHCANACIYSTYVYMYMYIHVHACVYCGIAHSLWNHIRQTCSSSSTLIKRAVKVTEDEDVGESMYMYM